MSHIKRLKSYVETLANNENFIHHQWFVAHHLNIIESLVEELLVRYPAADKDVCRAMVWVHDLGKIITNKGEDEEAITLQEIKHKLPVFGFTQEQVALITQVYHEMEAHNTLSTTSRLETQIISSADGLSHYIGPFFAAYWYENPQKSIKELIADNVKKIEKDLKKITLPEVKTVALKRMAMLQENMPASRPTQYLD